MNNDSNYYLTHIKILDEKRKSVREVNTCAAIATISVAAHVAGSHLLCGTPVSPILIGAEALGVITSLGCLMKHNDLTEEMADDALKLTKSK